MINGMFWNYKKRIRKENLLFRFMFLLKVNVIQIEWTREVATAFKVEIELLSAFVITRKIL